ncbi:MAG TPA: TIM barrel protein [Bryobacteraceae bacterium]|nr:TIM barrel protein [Bryobacteraceae bacterium]
MTLSTSQTESIYRWLDDFRIELPSWGFANTGTRFGKFLQAGAAVTLPEKLADAAQVHRVTGCCPTLAVHALWDFPNGIGDVADVKLSASRTGIEIGAINPNIFQDQIYKHGSLGSPDETARITALRHLMDSVEIGKRTGSRDISLWFADGSSYPGTANIRRRREWFIEGLQAMHEKLSPTQRMLIEYKPFEPAFYHTDIADWGMALLLARHAGPQAKVLVDTGHHYQTQNIEQIVAWLLAEDMLGGFHFNDRRYADDDLTLGSIDPYQVFRIFHEIHQYAFDTGAQPHIAYMIDQSHNLKPKIEEMIQTALAAQELYAKASLVDHAMLARHQANCSLIDAEECLKAAFYTDVRAVLVGWRRSKGLPDDPLAAFRESGYLARISTERAAGNAAAVTSYA